MKRDGMNVTNHTNYIQQYKILQNKIFILKLIIVIMI